MIATHVSPPSEATLKKYGLTLGLWTRIYLDQEGKCPICRRYFDEKVRPCIDHVHVRGYKKFPPEKKREYVRGICCFYCNQRRLFKGITEEIASNMVEYLHKFNSKLRRTA